MRSPSTRRGLADCFPCCIGLLCHFSPLMSPERDSLQLQVTQILGGGQGSGPTLGSTRQCALYHVPSPEAAVAEDEAWCFIIRYCRASGPGRWGSQMGLETDGKWDLEIWSQSEGPSCLPEDIVVLLLCVHPLTGLLLFLPTWWWQGQR